MRADYRQYIEKYSSIYKEELTGNIMPFWLKYGMDKVNGGLYTCLDRDGSVAQPAKGNLFKGPFHIPRMLVLSHILCNNIISNNTVL